MVGIKKILFNGLRKIKARCKMVGIKVALLVGFIVGFSYSLIKDTVQWVKKNKGKV